MRFSLIQRCPTSESGARAVLPLRKFLDLAISSEGLSISHGQPVMQLESLQEFTAACVENKSKPEAELSLDDTTLRLFPHWNCLYVPNTSGGKQREQVRQAVVDHAKPLINSFRQQLEEEAKRGRKHHIILGPPGDYFARLCGVRGASANAASTAEVSETLLLEAGWTILVDRDQERVSSAAVQVGRHRDQLTSKTSRQKGIQSLGSELQNSAEASDYADEELPAGPSSSSFFCVRSDWVFFLQHFLPNNCIHSITIPFPYPMPTQRHPCKVTANLLNILHEKLIWSHETAIGSSSSRATTAAGGGKGANLSDGGSGRLLIATDHLDWFKKECRDVVKESLLSVPWSTATKPSWSQLLNNPAKKSSQQGAFSPPIWDVAVGDYPRIFANGRPEDVDEGVADSAHRLVLRKAGPTPSAVSTENAKVTCWRYKGSFTPRKK
jgi:hypothetical protein